MKSYIFEVQLTCKLDKGGAALVPKVVGLSSGFRDSILRRRTAFNEKTEKRKNV